MEAGQIEDEASVGITTETSYASPDQQVHLDSPKFDPSRAMSTKMKQVKGANQESQEKDEPPRVSNCYIFKSRLQEYCQKAGLSTPVYDTIKEGPSHQPYFKSTVVVNNIRYDSLPAFFNRKTAEQSAAEVALIELAKSNTVDFGISQSVHETGLCKNLLQEYAQKMNYAIPLYTCSKEEKEGRVTMYSCVLEIGGIKYIGASASTKKEAEIKAARTALLAIQTAVPPTEDQSSNTIYTVIPQKRKASEPAITSQETKACLKTKRNRLKKPYRKKRRSLKNKSAGEMACLEAKTDGQAGDGLTVPEAVKFEPNSTVDVRVDMVGNGGMTVDTVDHFDSQIKTNGGTSIHEDSQKQEVCVTSVVISNCDSGNSGTTTCVTYDGNQENAGVPFGEYCKDLGSAVMDVN